jgi:hypothetical protein
MTRQLPAALRADYAAARARSGQPGQSFVRAAVAALASEATRPNRHEPPDIRPDEIVERYWPRDEAVEQIVRAIPNMISRAATTPLTSIGSPFALTAVSDFILTMGPASAASQLLAAGMSLTLDGAATILVPNIVAAAAGAAFVQQGAPIPVREQSIDAGVLLDIKKIAGISVFTRELFTSSVPTIESVVRAVMTENIGLALDSVLLGTAAGDTTQPAGLRSGISAGTQSANTDHGEAMLEDVMTLVTAVAPIAGNNPIALVAAPAQAMSLRMRLLGKDAPFQILSSSALAADVVVAIATNALASTIDPTPRFDISDSATVHMNTVPLPIVDNAGTTANPVRSLWQTDSIGLKAELGVNFGLRNSNGLAWLGSVIW